MEVVSYSYMKNKEFSSITTITPNFAFDFICQYGIQYANSKFVIFVSWHLTLARSVADIGCQLDIGDIGVHLPIYRVRVGWYRFAIGRYRRRGHPFANIGPIDGVAWVKQIQ